MNWHQEPIFQWLSQWAYQPYWVYTFVVIMMILSGFGLPIPEEVTLVSLGLLTFMAQHSELFGVEVSDATSKLEPVTAALVAAFSVLGADTLVFSLGRFFGPKIRRQRWFQAILSSQNQERIERWTQRYGSWTCAIFRFTPGLRFPGHLFFGMMNFPLWKFLLIDGLVVFISVPTQVILIATYGEVILKTLQRFKLIVLAVGLGVFFVWVLRRYLLSRWKSH